MANPEELFKAAKCITEIAVSDPLCRAAISRIYYASFHFCYRYNLALPHIGSVGYANGRHNQLISQLMNPSKKTHKQKNSESAAVGKMLLLLLLCAKRVEADYSLNKQVCIEDMTLCLTTADSLFKEFGG